jgi:hydroxymethylglutaryl-CoA lyase
MQGWQNLIPAAQKIAYLNQLLRVGFDTLDCASFVSPKAIPQMADSAEVLNGLELNDSDTKLLAIVANARGAEAAVQFQQLTYLGYPFSLSETFQKLNTNSTIAESWDRVQAIQEICVQYNKQMVVYLSMGFGNPYGDLYNAEVIATWVEKLSTIGIAIVSLADTVGLATADMVQSVTSATIQSFPQMEIGVHLHTTAEGFTEKLDAAMLAGCTRFDGALKGIGGCPMANNPLVGNMDTQLMIEHFDQKDGVRSINKQELYTAIKMAGEIFI